MIVVSLCKVIDESIEKSYGEKLRKVVPMFVTTFSQYCATYIFCLPTFCYSYSGWTWFSEPLGMIIGAGCLLPFPNGNHQCQSNEWKKQLLKDGKHSTKEKMQLCFTFYVLHNMENSCICVTTYGMYADDVVMFLCRSGTKWAHISCALWIPEVTIDCPDKMEPITNISQIPVSFRHRHCPTLLQ